MTYYSKVIFIHAFTDELNKIAKSEVVWRILSNSEMFRKALKLRGKKAPQEVAKFLLEEY